MKKSTAKDLYYTKEHEWIDFQGSVAYIESVYNVKNYFGKQYVLYIYIMC